MFPPRVKICCIRSVEEAELAIRHGASALGLVSAMPSGPGVISDHAIAAIARRVPPPVATFLLTSLTDPRAIIDQQKRLGTNTLQLCDRMTISALRTLRMALPAVSLVQVVHVSGEASLQEAVDAAPWVDALLLDSGDLSGPVKELGGTGRTHDWGLSARIVEASPVPVFLAGGLTAENVAEAIRHVRPFGLDLCTGVRTGETLDEDKLKQFMQVVAGEPAGADAGLDAPGR